jgi:cytochrome oxidase assembly protein ShyY1
VDRQARAAQWEHFERGAAMLVELDNGATAGIPLYQRVRATGTLDAQHQFLLDNRSYRDAGLRVLTPCCAPAPRLLVDRGWVPFSGSRRTLPE